MSTSPALSKKQQSNKQPKEIMKKPKIHSQSVVIVNNQDPDDEEDPHLSVDPLEQEITSMKISMNLIKQLSFNNSINKFDNFEQYLRKQFTSFNLKLNVVNNNQKQLMRKMKMIRDCAIGQTALINLPKNRKLDEIKVQKGFSDIAKLKEQTNKYKKLSVGMLNALNQLNQRLDVALGVKPPSIIKHKSEKLLRLEKKNSEPDKQVLQQDVKIEAKQQQNAPHQEKIQTEIQQKKVQLIQNIKQ